MSNHFEAYIKSKCGGFIRVKYKDDQCVYGLRNKGDTTHIVWFPGYDNSTQIAKFSKLELFMRPKVDGFKDPEANKYWQSIGAPNYSCFTNNTSLYWIWTKPADDACKGWFEDWFIIAPELFPRYHIAESSREPWKMYKNIYDVGTVTYPQECDTFLDWDFFAVAKDDVAVGHGGYFCNFKRALGDKPVPNLARIHSSQKFTEYVANPEKQPPATAKNKSIFKIEIDSSTYPDIEEPEDPFSTVAKIKNGYAHFINAAKYGQTPDETWKDEWVKLKVTINIPGLENQIGKIPKSLGVWLYYDDPNLDDKSEDIWPTNPKLSNENNVILDPSGRQVGKDNIPESINPLTINLMSANDQANLYKQDKAGFTIFDVRYPGPVSAQKALYIKCDDYIYNSNLNGELYAYFRTGKYGGNNYKIKAIVGVPSCFMWDEIDTVTTWRKYPVFVSVVKAKVPQKPSAGIGNNLWKGKIPKFVKGGFDDGFAYIVTAPRGQGTGKDPGPFKWPQVGGSLGVYDLGSDTSYEIKATDFSSDLCNCQFIYRSNQACMVHNLHLVFFPFLLNGKEYSNKKGDSYTTGTSDWGELCTVVSNEFFEKRNRKEYDDEYEIAQCVIHEFGHLIPHFCPQYWGHAQYTDGDPSVMNYGEYWNNEYNGFWDNPRQPWRKDYGSGIETIPMWFNIEQIALIRSGYKHSVTKACKWPQVIDQDTGKWKWEYLDSVPIKEDKFYTRRP